MNYTLFNLQNILKYLKGSVDICRKLRKFVRNFNFA